ncbi:MAG: hypothetical protein K0S86_5757 [Geminicoccaceae bacterium]|nr:hypothetical protein [Geminicoccaceae bacterium]
MQRVLHSARSLVMLAAVITGCDTQPPTVTPLPGSDATVAVAAAPGQTLYALTTSGRLIRFSSTDPCVVDGTLQVTGLAPNATLQGIDFRPATGQLYGLGSDSRLYTIELPTGVATAVSTVPFSPALDGEAFGFDFNPTVDRIRVVSNTGQNLRLNPVTGAIAAVDGPLAYVATDANSGTRPRVVGAAYTNPDNDPATGTLLYDLDVGVGVFATQNPPNDGTLNTVGSVGVRRNDLIGFDIAPSNIGYVALKVTGPRQAKRTCGNSDLYAVNLTTGATTRVGGIGTPTPIRGIAAPAP